MQNKTSWKTLVEFKRVSSSSLIEKEQTYTIKKITDPTEIVADDGRKSKVPLCYFVENDLPMVLNKTNFKTLEILFNSEFREDWYGRKITVFVKDGIKFGNKTVSGLRIKDTNQSPIVPCDDCEDIITATAKNTVDKLIEIGEKTYGKKLCAKCLAVAKAAVAEGANND